MQNHEPIWFDKKEKPNDVKFSVLLLAQQNKFDVSTIQVIISYTR
jgi:hypothetical protein